MPISIEPSPLIPALFSVPSKVMILGEYAVLDGAPALMAAIPPFFQLIPDQNTSDTISRFPSQSPIGRWLSTKKIKSFPFEIRDPHQGRGGFGASTAEFLLAIRSGLDPLHSYSNSKETEIKDVLSLYHALHREEPLPPSGADLMIQVLGGVSWVWPRTIQSFRFPHFSFPFLVFSATHQESRKIKTHEHLKEIQLQPEKFSLKLEGLKKILEKALVLSKREDLTLTRMADFINEYAEEVNRLGWESALAEEDRKVAKTISGVLGAKGCGAGLSDVFLVLCDAQQSFSHVISEMKKRNLHLVSHGLGQPGESG